MNEEFSRSIPLFGIDYLEKLKNKWVMVFGLGGVGGYVVEALARSGISNFYLVDNDTISLSNINRQIISLHSNIDEYKTVAMKNRILDINPNANVITYNLFYLPSTKDSIDLSKADYVVDAIDTITAKIDLITECFNSNIKIISSMGAGNKLDPTKLEVSDIYNTSMDPLSKTMRKELKKRGVTNLKVVYSKEQPLAISIDDSNGRHTPSSAIFVPASIGLLIAKEVILDLLKEE